MRKKVLRSGSSAPLASKELARRSEHAASETWWLGGITYVWTTEGWHHLATLLDVPTRRVAGRDMSSRIDTALVTSALEMARGRVGSAPHGHHSDRGSQHARGNSRRRLDELDIRCSMSRRANCRGDAVAESSFGTVKVEWLDHHRVRTRDEARAAAFGFIEVLHDRRRRHASLGHLSPEACAGALTTA